MQILKILVDVGTQDENKKEMGEIVIADDGKVTGRIYGPHGSTFFVTEEEAESKS